MPTVRVETFIPASPEICFDLARDVDVHKESASHTGETVVAGVTSGLLELGDFVTFEGRHLGIRQRLTSKIVQFDRPNSFTDQMQQGPFKSLRHQHLFEEVEGGTKMVDILEFRAPFGPLGWIAEVFVLKIYMRRFLAARGEHLKELATS